MFHRERAAAAAAHQAGLCKPPGSLGRLEELAVQLAGIQDTAAPRSRPAAALIFAADHAVCRYGVSAYPAEVTAAMLQNFARGGAAGAVLAAELGVSLQVVDVGVNAPPSGAGCGISPPVVSPPRRDGQAPRKVVLVRNPVAGQPAGDLVEADAMSPGVLEAAMEAGAAALHQAGPAPTVLLLGEMGIGNTTCAAALAAALLGCPARDVVGPGTGLPPERVVHKAEVVARALRRARPGSPREALQKLGGRDLAAVAGAALAALGQPTAILVDGFAVSAALLVACALEPALREQLIFSHRSAEPGHDRVLSALGATPLLDLQLRLGEASGALVALPLLDLACRLHAGMATLRGAGVPGPTGA